MPGVPRFSLDEIVARHEIASGLFDTVVEGFSDVHLLRAVAERIGSSADIIAIDQVDVPERLVTALGIPTEGNRGRVVAAAYELLRLGVRPTRNIVLVADSDSDIALRSQSGNPLLRYSPVSDLGMYLYDRRIAENLICLNTSLSLENASRTLDVIEGACTAAFAFRVALRRARRDTAIPRLRTLFGMDYPSSGVTLLEVANRIGAKMPAEVTALVAEIVTEITPLPIAEKTGSHCLFGELAAFFRGAGVRANTLRDEFSLKVAFTGGAHVDTLATVPFLREILFSGYLV